MDQNKQNVGCNPITTGKMPMCGMLAVPYVPVQRSTEGSYEADNGLAKGTLFPGLDLPYRGMVNEKYEQPTPLQELMALGFAVDELNLYLDTHPEDKEAGELFNRYNKLYSEGMAEYERRYGPLQVSSADGTDFTWVNDPWPWDFPKHRTEKRNMPMKKED